MISKINHKGSNPFLLAKAYSSVVEQPAHDGFVVGSIPSKLISSRFLLYVFNYLLFLFIMYLVSSAKLVGAGLATIGLVGAGVGIGIIFGAFLMAYSRNPQLKDDLFKYAILGFALTEAIALFALMMAFLILYS